MTENTKANITDSKINDLELVERLKEGDIEAFEEIVVKYRARIYHLALRITKNQEDAEEALQDTFTSVYKNISKFRGDSAFSSWIYRITTNSSLMLLRKNKRHQAVQLEEEGVHSQENWLREKQEGSDITYLSTRHELREVLQNAIRNLPEEYQAIFVLRDVDGMSNSEVSTMLNLSLPAVKSRLHRARLYLRRTLESYYQDYFCNETIFFGNGLEQAPIQ